MNPNQDVHIRNDVPFYQGQVLIIVNVVDKCNGPELSVGRAKGRFISSLNKRLRPHPIGNNISDRGDFEIVFFGKGF